MAERVLIPGLSAAAFPPAMYTATLFATDSRGAAGGAMVALGSGAASWGIVK